MSSAQGSAASASGGPASSGRAAVVRSVLVRVPSGRWTILAGLVAAIALLVPVLVHFVAADPTPAAARPSATAAVGDALTLLAPSDGHGGQPLVLVAGKPMFPLATGGGLGGSDGAPVEAQEVRVQAVVPGAGFWIGNDASQRVFVLVGEGSGPGPLPTDGLHPGETVNLSGRLQPLPADPAQIGLDPTGVDQLQAQGQLVRPNSVRPTS